MSPNAGEFALNCDGSVVEIGLVASCGDVLRDKLGRFMFGYAAKLGSCSVLEAELWGILHGLMIVWSRGFRNLVVY